MVNILVIIIDGSGGVGKGMLCKVMVEVLGWYLLDLGVIYCVLVLVVLYYYVDVEFEEVLVFLVVYFDVCFIFIDGNLEVVLEGEDVSSEICIQEVVNVVLKVVVFLCVCEVLLCCQCVFCELLGFIVDGCDMGMVVFLDVLVKIFFDVLVDEWVYCCMWQLQEKGFDVNFECFLFEIKECDDCD